MWQWKVIEPELESFCRMSCVTFDKLFKLLYLHFFKCKMRGLGENAQGSFHGPVREA